MSYGIKKDQNIPRKKHTPEKIVAKLREVDVVVSQGVAIAEAVRQIEVGKFTFEVQRLIVFIEYLFWRFEAKAFSRRVVVAAGEGGKGDVRKRIEIGASGQRSSQPAVHVFNATLLPGVIRIAEVGFEEKGFVQLVMFREFGPVVVGKAAAELARQAFEPAPKLAEHHVPLAVRGLGDESKAGGAFVSDEQILPPVAEAHHVGFPMTGFLAFIDVGGSFGNGNTVLDYIDRAVATLAGPPAAMSLSGQEAVQVNLLGAAEIDVAVDSFVTDAHARAESHQSASYPAAAK
jgi:hypothetical protein